MLNNENERRKILPVGSGKGGTGKTLVAANLAVDIASNGRKVLLVDLDLGGANCHTLLGIKNSNICLSNYLLGDIEFAGLVQQTPYANLGFIAGDGLIPGSAAMLQRNFRSVIEQILKLSFDYIVIDLPTGGGEPSLHSFLVSNSGLLVCTPDLPSILSLYNFLRSAVVNHCHTVATAAARGHDRGKQGDTKRKKIADYFAGLYRNLGIGEAPSLGQILVGVDKIDGGIAAELRDDVHHMHPYLVMNRLRGREDFEFCKQVLELVSENLEIKVEVLGGIFESREVVRSIDEQVPVVTGDESLAGMQVGRLSQKILLSPDFPTMPLDFDSYANSYELTAIEVSQDEGSYMAGAPAPAHQDIGDDDDDGDGGGGNASDALAQEESAAKIEAQAQRIRELEEQVSQLETTAYNFENSRDSRAAGRDVDAISPLP